MRFIMLVLVFAICNWSFFCLMRRFLVSICHPGRLITSNKTPVHPINYPRESWIFAYRVSLMCTRIINNIPHIKMCGYVQIYIFLGSFAQPKCDGFLEWMNRSLYHTIERNGYKKVRSKILAQQLQSCLALRTRNKN